MPLVPPPVIIARLIHLIMHLNDIVLSKVALIDISQAAISDEDIQLSANIILTAR
jgi:hypothetical protein